MAAIKKKLSQIGDLIITERAFYLLIMITMISLPICELLVEQHSRNFEGQPIIVEAAGIAGIVMAVTWFIKNKAGVKLHPSDIMFFLLVIFSGLSLAFTEDMLASVQGYDYDEWLTHFMAYFSLMFAGTMVRDKGLRQNILKAFIFVLLIHGIIGVFQTMGFEFTNCFFDGDDVTRLHIPYGLTAHFNWFCALMALAGGCAMGTAIFAGSRKHFLIFSGLTAIAFYDMFSTESMIGLLSAAVLIVFYPVALLIYRARNKEDGIFRQGILRWLAIAVMTGAVFSFCYFALDRYNGEFEAALNEIGNVTSSSAAAADAAAAAEAAAADIDAVAADSEADPDEVDPANGPVGFLSEEEEDETGLEPDNTAFDKFGTGRGHIWKYGLACVPDHWAFGVGLDNYRWCFKHAPGLVHKTWSQGKGHNEYIHYLVTQGAFQLLTILSFIVYTFVVGIRTVLKTSDKEERVTEFILMGMFTAYVVQALINSSVVNIAPYYWITAGMLLCKKHQRPFGWRKAQKQGGED